MGYGIIVSLWKVKYIQHNIKDNIEIMFLMAKEFINIKTAQYIEEILKIVKSKEKEDINL